MVAEKSERVYIVPLGKAYLTTRTRRARRAIDILRDFIRKHAKTDGDNVRISNALNSYLWSRSRKKPPRRVKIKVLKQDEKVMAYLYDEKIEEKKPEEKPKEEIKKEEKKPEEKPPEEKKETKLKKEEQAKEEEALAEKEAKKAIEKEETKIESAREKKLVHGR
ncbi:MAG: 50S ribosomal protein L31e [Candidatus Bilamarchaeaceae archaeon]